MITIKEKVTRNGSVSTRRLMFVYTFLCSYYGTEVQENYVKKRGKTVWVDHFVDGKCVCRISRISERDNVWSINFFGGKELQKGYVESFKRDEEGTKNFFKEWRSNQYNIWHRIVK